MKFVFKKDHLEINFNWREMFRIIITKSIKLNKKSAYKFSSSLMHIVAEMTEKYGDGKVHGNLSEENLSKDE